MGDETHAAISAEDQDTSGKTGNVYVVLLRGSAMPSEKGVHVAYERLDTSAALVEALRGHSFVEFPTLEVIHEREWSEVGHEWEPNDEEKEGESGGSDDRDDQDAQERIAKRRKIDEEAGKRLLGGLAVYIGEEDDEEGNSDYRAVPEKKQGALLEMLDYSSDSSEVSNLEVAPTHAGKPPLDLGSLGEDEEVDWDDE
jgi:hypothetical protein